MSNFWWCQNVSEVNLLPKNEIKESSARKLVLKNNKILLSLLLFPARENQYKKKPQNRRGGIHMITEVLFDC